MRRRKAERQSTGANLRQAIDVSGDLTHRHFGHDPKGGPNKETTNQYNKKRRTPHVRTIQGSECQKDLGRRRPLLEASAQMSKAQALRSWLHAATG